MKKILKINVLLMLLCGIMFFAKSGSVTIFASTEGVGTKEVSIEEACEVESDISLVSIEDWKALPVGEYPITPDSPEWKTMSYCDALVVCNMPKEYAESLSTDDLCKYAVNYPFLGDIMMFDSIEDGINSLKAKSAVFEELFSRSDCDAALLKEYREMSCDYKVLEEQKDMSASGYMEQMFLEAYFGLHYGNLTDEESDMFLDEYDQKYTERPEDKKDYSTATIFYDCMTESTGYVPEDTLIDGIKDKIISENVANELSFTTTGSQLVTISVGSKCYVGYENIKGRNISCYKFFSGDYTSTERAEADAFVAKNYPTYVKVRSATKMHNCHSYAWYSTKETNPLWIVDPTDIYTNKAYYKKRTSDMELASGYKMLFFSGSTLKHSAILISSKKCKSKLGRYGVYKTTLKEMKAVFDAPDIKTYIRINK